MTIERTGDAGLATRLKSLREALGITQEDLAERAGVAKNTLQKIEQGERYGRKETHKKLADALGVSVLELLSTPENSQNGFETVKPDYVDFAVWLSSQGELSQKDFEKIKKLIKAYLDE